MIFLFVDVIEFSNSYSWVRNKKLSYFVELFKSEEHRKRNMEATTINPSREEIETLEGEEGQNEDQS